MSASQPLQALIAGLQDPNSLRTRSLAEWDAILPLARGLHLQGVLAERIRDAGFSAPECVQWHLDGMIRESEYHQRRIRWELNRLERVLQDAAGEFSPILLKGAAYLAADLPPGQGRISADVDLLLPEPSIPAFESFLLQRGWEHKPLDERDAAYFREWLHEIPPLVHHFRKVEIDIHHNLLPRTDRLCDEPGSWIARSRSLSGSSPFRILADDDLVIHSACHLFRNGDFTKGLRDLWDVDQLIRHFRSQDSAYQERLLDRARELRLAGPVSMAIRSVNRIFGTGVALPRRWYDHFRISAKLLDRIADRALYPRTVRELDTVRRKAMWMMAHYPLPRPRTMFSPLFWLKRLPFHKQ